MGNYSVHISGDRLGNLLQGLAKIIDQEVSLVINLGSTRLTVYADGGGVLCSVVGISSESFEELVNKIELIINAFKAVRSSNDVA